MHQAVCRGSQFYKSSSHFSKASPSNILITGGLTLLANLGATTANLQAILRSFQWFKIRAGRCIDRLAARLGWRPACTAWLGRRAAFALWRQRTPGAWGLKI